MDPILLSSRHHEPHRHLVASLVLYGATEMKYEAADEQEAMVYDLIANNNK
jgi:hypothetical protein